MNRLRMSCSLLFCARFRVTCPALWPCASAALMVNCSEPFCPVVRPMVICSPAGRFPRFKTISGPPEGDEELAAVELLEAELAEAADVDVLLRSTESAAVEVS